MNNIELDNFTLIYLQHYLFSWQARFLLIIELYMVNAMTQVDDGSRGVAVNVRWVQGDYFVFDLQK